MNLGLHVYHHTFIEQRRVQESTNYYEVICILLPRTLRFLGAQCSQKQV